jgi:hypothetical protein
MPKRVIDFDAMWGSDKLLACAEWAQAEYAWLYGLADASGCFELTNLRVIWGRVAAIRRNLTIERLEQVFDEFQDKGLLFVWEHEGKRYGHWTGSDVPGRLPPPSWRMRLERFAPPVPKQRLAEYMAQFSRGRAALASAEFRGAEREEPAGKEGNFRFESSNFKENRMRAEEKGGGELKAGFEAAQAQDWDLNWDENRNWKREVKAEADGPCGERARGDAGLPRLEGAKSGFSNSPSNSTSDSEAKAFLQTAASAPPSTNSSPAFRSAHAASAYANANARSYRSAEARMDYRALAVERELRVGQGPVCGPARVRPEALERARKRDAARREHSP